MLFSSFRILKGRAPLPPHLSGFTVDAVAPDSGRNLISARFVPPLPPPPPPSPSRESSWQRRLGDCRERDINSDTIRTTLKTRESRVAGRPAGISSKGVARARARARSAASLPSSLSSLLSSARWMHQQAASDEAKIHELVRNTARKFRGAPRVGLSLLPRFLLTSSFPSSRKYSFDDRSQN